MSVLIANFANETLHLLSDFIYWCQLEALLDRNIDLVSVKSLKNPILIEEINRSKVELYAA
jgi:predicted nucleotidyltransferase